MTTVWTIQQTGTGASCRVSDLLSERRLAGLAHEYHHNQSSVPLLFMQMGATMRVREGFTAKRKATAHASSLSQCRWSLHLPS
jgi:hypothetical protein